MIDVKGSIQGRVLGLTITGDASHTEEEFREFAAKLMEASTCRPEILAFAFAMEQRLRAHDLERGPTGWKRAHPFHLLGWLQAQYKDLHEAVVMSDHAAVRKKAIDLGNLCMMVVDVTPPGRDG